MLRSSGALTVAEFVPLVAVAAISTMSVIGFASVPLAIVVVLVHDPNPHVHPMPLMLCCANPAGKMSLTVMVSPASVSTGPLL